MSAWSGKIASLLIVAGLLAGAGNPAAFAADRPATDPLVQCETLLVAGKYRECRLLAAEQLASPGLSDSDELSLRIFSARALGELGRYGEALGFVRQAEEQLQKGVGRERAAELDNLAGALLLGSGALDEAKRRLEAASETARRDSNWPVLAAALNNGAIVLLRQQQPQQALQLATDGIKAAEQAGRSDLVARLELSRVNALHNLERADAAMESIQRAEELFRKQSPTPESVAGLQAVADWYRQANAPLQAKRTYTDALVAALQLGDNRRAGYAAGNLGRLAEQEKSYPEAVKQTRTAIFYAQFEQSPELLYQWQWQSARLFRVQGLPDEAVRMNRLAVQTIQSIKQEFAQADATFFQQQIKPVYLGLIDLLLARAGNPENGQRKTALLEEVVATIELLRSDELKDYLRDSCVSVDQQTMMQRKETAGKVAVIYYIAFPDRIEAIVRAPAGMHHFSVAAPTLLVSAEALLLRDFIEKRSESYLASSRRLYDWLIAPLAPFLPGAETLVFVPDGPIRTIPLAALHDGSRFLIEKYPLALTQGLTMTAEYAPLSYRQADVFLGGISEAVGGAPAIPFVADELTRIRQLYAGRIMKNDAFTMAGIDHELQRSNYPVLHIASHGQFAGNAAGTYLLTWDGRMNLDDLVKFVKQGRSRQSSVDLLTLSACSTAVGDERASLGLAGVALKAGVKSAVASLWDIDDKATADFFVMFYRLLQDEPSLSKAAVLRKVQLAMMLGNGPLPPAAGLEAETGPVAQNNDNPYRHPFFWAPFILTGNWL